MNRIRNPQRPLGVEVVESVKGYNLTKIFYPGGVVRFGLRKMYGTRKFECVGVTHPKIENAREILNRL